MTNVLMISGNPTFGKINENMYQSDYINKKKNMNKECKKRCVMNVNTCEKFPINKSNLIKNKYVTMNLENVYTVSKIFPPYVPVKIDESDIIPFYYNYQIDPLGSLFGLSQCGELNYTEYMVSNLPKN